MKIKITFSLLFLSVLVLSQNHRTIEINFTPKYKNHTIAISDDKSDILDPENGLEISQLKFYLSNFQLIKNDEIVFSEEKSFHLLDATMKETMDIKLSVPDHLTFDTVRFFIGIDKETNNNGISGGDLDPAKGMYWSWQTGYINVKIEGKSRLCNTRKNEFMYHLGGFLDDNYIYNSVDILAENKNYITVNLSLDKMLSEINFSKKCQMMTPGTEAKELLNQFSKILILN